MPVIPPPGEASGGIASGITRKCGAGGAVTDQVRTKVIRREAVTAFMRSKGQCVNEAPVLQRFLFLI